MTRTLFTDGWTFRRAGSPDGTPVRLPHDAMIGEARVPEGGTGNHGGYFPGGVYLYRTLWTPPTDDPDTRFQLTFDGVQGRTRVLVNGEEAATSDNPYRPFTVPLPVAGDGEPMEITVEVDNSLVPNSRWYTGSGIYRPVWLEAIGPVAFAPDGIRVSTRQLVPAPESVTALVDVQVDVRGDLPASATVDVALRFGDGTASRRTAELDDGRARVEIPVEDARLWSAEEANLYDVRVAVTADGEVLDERRLRTGLRTIEVDAQHGLRVNGAPVLLRGTAVHHDNGPLGAVTLAAAERRRARLLKAAGFNAIRSAHNPMSAEFLDACDELGLYVMDELTDVWYRHKTPHDAADTFQSEWRDDVDAMIAKDRNHPAVIMYSIGNEITESAMPAGVELGARIHRAFATADPTRPTTIAVNPLLAMMAGRAKPGAGDADAPPERKPATSTAANQLTAKLGRLMVLASTLPAADRATRDVFATVDIAGYNYAYAGYRKARKRYRDRVILGTESMPGDLPAIWKRVTSIPGVIGDFSWTGWDYLGEVGLGYWTYGSEPGGIAKPYPGLLAGCGVFDITGAPTATLHLVQAVWGVTYAPGLAVRPLDQAGTRPNKTPWLPTDAVNSWSWGGHEGVAEIEVYSAADHVELLLNGRSLGRKRAGAAKKYLARFTARYEPGELTAVAYRRGVEVGRSTLRSAAAPALRVRAESDRLSGPDDLAYVRIELADEDGTVDVAAQDRVTVHVEGPGSLAALGSAAPATEETFTGISRHTYRGRALAIIRGGDAAGPVVVTVTSERHGTAQVTLHGGAEPAGLTAAGSTPARKDTL